MRVEVIRRHFSGGEGLPDTFSVVDAESEQIVYSGQIEREESATEQNSRSATAILQRLKRQVPTTYRPRRLDSPILL